MPEIGIVKNKPIAKFMFNGTRRTILVTGQNRYYLEGYELTDGNVERDLDDAPVKSYRRTEIDGGIVRQTLRQHRTQSARATFGTNSTVP